MPDISKRLAKAQKYMERGKYADALEEYKHAYREDPANDNLVEMIADMYLRQNETQKALDCYGYLFDKRVEQNDGPGTVLMYRKMSRLGPQDPARTLTCAEFQEKQKPTEALDLYRACVEKFLESGDQGQALKALHRLVALDPGNPSEHIRLGELAEGIGQKEEAAQAFIRASEALGARDSGGRFRDQSVSLLERAYSLVPDELRMAIPLATALVDSDNPSRAVEVLESLPAPATAERNRLLVQAYLAAGKIDQAETLLWDLAPRLPEAHSHLFRVFESYFASGNAEAAFRVLQRLKQAMFSANKDEEFLGWVEGLEQQNSNNFELVEFLASAYQELNQGARCNETLSRLFDLALNAGEYVKATRAFESLTAARSNPAEDQPRLERLREHVDEQTYQALAARLRSAPSTAAGPDNWMDAFEIAPEAGAAPAAQASSAEGIAPAGALEDMMLQVELFLQFGQKDEAIRYLQQITHSFPGEDSRNGKLRSLLVEAGLAPPPAGVPAAAASKAAAPEEAAVDMARISAIVRSIYRQSTVQSVLSTGVGEIGKSWQVSRCVVTLGAPGRPPTAMQEYLAEGIPPSAGAAAVPLVSTLMQLTLGGDPLVVEDAKGAADLSRVGPAVQSLGIQSLLALPLVEGEKPRGVLVLEQCDRLRRWDSQQVVALKTVVDQMAMAISNVRLRSLMKVVANESSGLLARSSYVDYLLSETARAQRQKTPLSVALLQFGEGPQAVRELRESYLQEYMREAAQGLAGQLRQNDVGIRYDATTLAMVLNGTNGKDALPVVERIRRMVASIRIEDRAGLPVTVGVAEAVLRGGIEPPDIVTELINRVETALETAHTEGATSKLLALPAK